MAESPEPEILESDLLKQDINYPKVLMWHISRIAAMSARPSDSLGLKSAVWTLEALLKPYLDDEYYAELKKGMNDLDKGKVDYLGAWVTNRTGFGADVNKAFVNQSLAKLYPLISLMARKNLLLEEHTAVRA